MTTTISPKYQIVIPKAVRQQLNIRPGQKMQVEAAADGSITIRHADASTLESFYGVLKNKAAYPGGAIAYQRSLRDDAR